MKKREYIIALLIGIIGLFSCVKEQDREDCPPEGIDLLDSRQLMFQLKPVKYSFTNLVESLKLYLYDDSSNSLVDTRSVSRTQLEDSDYIVSLDEWVNWRDDHHHIVAVMNQSPSYRIAAEQLLASYRTHILPHAQDSVLDKLDDIFVGYYKLEAPTRAIATDTMWLEKLTNHIFVTVEFRGYNFPEDHTLVTHIRGSNATYDYLNQLVNSSTLTYMPHNQSRESSRIFGFDLTTGKLFIGDDLKLCLQDYDAHGVLVAQNQLDLTEEIISLRDRNGNYIYDTQEELEAEDEFYLNFILDDQFNIIELRINNWYTVNPGIEL